MNKLQALAAQIKAQILRIPEGVRFAVRDAIEGALAAVVALNLAFPTSVSGAEGEAVIAWTAAAGAGIAVLRRELLPLIAAKLGL